MEWTGLILIQQFNATRVQPKGAGIMTTDESEQATDRARARAYRTRLRAERDRQDNRFAWPGLTMQTD